VDVANIVVRKAEGNPLYALEVFRELKAGGGTLGESGRLTGLTGFDAATLPRRFQNLFSRRLAGLSDADRMLVGVAADLFLKFPESFRHREERIRKAMGGDEERFTSIRGLSADNPTLRELARRPVAVPFHTIVGGKDNVVPYESAHLKGARSEHVVAEAAHGAPWYSDCWDEVRRILKEHR